MTPEHAEAEIQSIIRRVAERHGASVTFEYEWHEGVTKVRANYNLSVRRSRVLGLLLCGQAIACVEVFFVLLAFDAYAVPRNITGAVQCLWPMAILSLSLCAVETWWRPASLDAICKEYRSEIARRMPRDIEFT